MADHFVLMVLVNAAERPDWGVLVLGGWTLDEERELVESCRPWSLLDQTEQPAIDAWQIRCGILAVRTERHELFS